MKHHDFSILGGHLAMNFYLFENDSRHTTTIRDLIEADFNNNLVGIGVSPTQAYDDLLQLRVDIMIISSNDPEVGIQLIKRLEQVQIKPHYIMISSAEDVATKEAAYHAGIDFFLEHPVSPVEFKHVTRLVASYCQQISKLSEIYNITSQVVTPFNRPQSEHRLQMDRVNAILRFLGIASETGNKEILKIIRIMVDQNISFSSIDFQRDLGLDEHEKKIVYQRIRRALRVGITNLAGMCSEYSENEVLLEYANALFEYQNVYIEIQKMRHEDVPNGQISLQHFFDGLLQESHGKLSI